MLFYWISYNVFQIWSTVVSKNELGNLNHQKHINIYILNKKTLMYSLSNISNPEEKEFGFSNRIDINTLDLSSNVSILNRKFLTFNS